ncbi:hypothetical protein AK812_SmicGene45142, partial [Symbiodinium microadriaticum]
VETLLAAGSSTAVKDRAGHTPEDLANLLGFRQLAQLLAAELSEEEKKAVRAKPLGPAELSEEEKKAVRAKRWGLASDTGTSAAPTSTETEEKLAARAKRWGLPETPEKEEESAKLTARAKRWGLSETRAAPTKRLPDSVSEAKNDLE